MPACTKMYVRKRQHWSWGIARKEMGGGREERHECPVTRSIPLRASNVCLRNARRTHAWWDALPPARAGPRHLLLTRQPGRKASSLEKLSGHSRLTSGPHSRSAK